MRPSIRALLLAGGALALAAPAQAQTFTNFLTFGDSLVDSGQRIDPGLVYPGFPIALPTDARWRYTNRVSGGQYGDTYAGQLSLALGYGTLYPSAPQETATFTASGTGLNYGVGGAKAADVRAQIESATVVPATPFYPATTTTPGFLNGSNAGLAPGSLAVVSAGGNDIRDLALVTFNSSGAVTYSNFVAPADIAPLMTTAAAETAAGVQSLLDAGVGLVIVPNLPNLGAIPETAFLDSITSLLSLPAGTFSTLRGAGTTAYNSALQSALAGKSNVLMVDFNGLFNDLVANPLSFGFADINHTAYCYNNLEFTGIPCVEDATYGQGQATPTGNPYMLLFNDGIHPTTRAHQALAQLLASQIAAPAHVGVAPHLTLGAARSLTDAFDQAALETGPQGFRIFGGFGAGMTERKAQGFAPAIDAQGLSGHVGATYAAAPGLTLGAGLGYRQINAKANGVGPSYDGGMIMGGAFAHVEQGPIFGTLALAAGRGSLDVTRKTAIAGATVSNTGETSGMTMGASLSAGAKLLEAGGVTLGPIARLEVWRSSLDGYAENGPSWSALRVGDLKANSTRGGAGAFAEAKGGAMKARAELLYEREFADAQSINVASASLGGAGWSAPGLAPDKGGLRLGLQAGLDLGFGTASLAYTIRMGENETTQGVNAQVNIPF